VAVSEIGIESEPGRLDAEVAAEALEPEAGMLADADPIGFADAMADLGRAFSRDPSSLASIRTVSLQFNNAFVMSPALGFETASAVTTNVMPALRARKVQ